MYISRNEWRKLMSSIADLTSAVAAVQAAVNKLDDDFKALTAQLSSGASVLSASDQAALDQANSSLQALVTQVNTDDPAPAVPPVTPEPPTS